MWHLALLLLAHLPPPGVCDVAGGAGSVNSLPTAPGSRLAPSFDAATPRNVTALVGKSAYLSCRVRNLGNRTILVALSFYGTGCYQRIVVRRNGMVMSQQSVSKAIREVTKALNHRDILTKYIKFPQTAEERNVIKRKFYEKFHIPSVVGCIDGTHVAIIRPTEHEKTYFNRKHYHSRNVQIICDSNMNILSVDATFGGATHDSFIFNQHPVKAHLLELKSRGETVYLLGDSGYAQRAYMMTPVLNAEAGSPEEHYTQRHCSARNTVERTIGLLKARWRCLLRHRVLHYDPQNAAKIINACCVLL